MDHNLKDLRKRKKMTQQAAAEYLNVSLRSYKTYENDPSKTDSFKYRYMLDRLSEINPIDEDHGILTLEEIRECCHNVFRDYPVSFAYLFGSYAKGSAREDSDVDLLISTDLTGMKYFGLVERIRTELNKKVDLLTTEQLVDNKALMEEIFKDGVKIYG